MAPAGNQDALLAAVNSGADAVYLGGSSFSARQGAANFDRDAMAEAIDYAHLRGVKIYVTVNTLINNGEMKEAAEYLYFLASLRADAIILQDLGLASLSRCLIPSLELHASTQMTIHNAAGARFLKDHGFQRVVLARELSLDSIRVINQEGSLGTEVFVHGALCFSYSGQCLLSSIIGGRSGNRGRCAQPCRMQYTLLGKKGKEVATYKNGRLLSMRDLNTLDLLPQLISTGVAALKIEGRMKSPEYVATVTRIYRGALDRALQDPENYETTAGEQRDLAQAFNREFTQGYLLHNPGKELMSYQRSNNRGVFLGRVEAVDNRVHLALAEPLAVGDGLEFWIGDGHKGIVVNRLWEGSCPITKAEAGNKVQIEIIPGVRKGDRVFKTRDFSLNSTAREAYSSRETGRLPLVIKVEGEVGSPLVVEGLCLNDLRARVVSPQPTEEALNKPLDEVILREKLGRLGNTPFRLAGLEVNLTGNLMLPVSQLNRLRQELVEQLMSRWRDGQVPLSLVDADSFHQALANELSGKKSLPAAVYKHKVLLSIMVGNAQAAQAAAEAGADRVYLRWEKRRGQRKEPLQSILDLKEKGATVGLAMPRIWHPTEEGSLKKWLEEIQTFGVNLIVVSNQGSLRLVQEVFPKAGIHGDYPLNVFNSLTAKFLLHAGLHSLCLSPELTLEQVGGFSPGGAGLIECVVHGFLPLMVSEHCVPGAVAGGCTTGSKCTAPCKSEEFFLRDRLSLLFPLESDQRCRMTVYNSKELCLYQKLDQIIASGIGAIRIEAGNKELDYVKTTVTLYRQALDTLKEGKKELYERMAGPGMEQLATLERGEFTTGHFFRGVN